MKETEVRRNGLDFSDRLVFLLGVFEEVIFPLFLFILMKGTVTRERQR